jgi:thiosulfate/3-mercaptopyruvate sulfurtransferase
MKKKILAFAVSLAAGGAAFAAQPLLAPTDLKAQLGAPNVRVIDIRAPKVFAEAHIPGAVNAPYEKTWRGPATNPGEVPPIEKLTATVRALGLTPTTHIVVVSTGSDAPDFGAAARVYWTLKYLGFKELSLLNGGVKSWTEAKLPLDQSVAQVTPSNVTPQLDTSVIATRDEVLQDVNQHSAVLVDARPKDFFLGETRAPASKMPGTLPGAIDVAYGKFFADEKSGILRPEKVQAVASSSLDTKKPTVAFCNTGHLAATDWFAMHELLGMNAKLYPGSMADWTQDPRALPMANVPNRAKQLLIDAKMWADKK